MLIHTTMWTNPKETILNEKSQYYSSMMHNFISVTSLKYYENYTDDKQISLGRRGLKLLTGYQEDSCSGRTHTSKMSLHKPSPTPTPTPTPTPEGQVWRQSGTQRRSSRLTVEVHNFTQGNLVTAASHSLLSPSTGCRHLLHAVMVE